MTFAIRIAEPGDIERMHAIRSAVRENPLTATSVITVESYLPYVAAASAWVAERDNKIVGFAVADEATSSVWALFVRPAHHGSGVGRALHDAMLKWAGARGIRQLGLQTTSGTRAELFYRKSGWSAGRLDENGQLHFRRLV
jgi:GNAT superfamily N-acetyltransferase